MMIGVPDRWSPEQGAAIERLRELAVTGDDPSPAAVRARYEAELRWWNAGGPDMPCKERWLPTRHGLVRALIFGVSDALSPGIWFIHGGGYIVGSPNTHHRLTRTLAAMTGATVVSLDYTLAPESRYPQPIEESIDAWQAVLADPAGIGVDPEDWSFAGDSVGASIALASAMMLRDQEVPNAVRSLLLFYGGYGLRDGASRRTMGGYWDGMTPEAMASWEAQYIDADQVSDRYYDLLAADLSGLPPCCVVAAELDPLLDDSLALRSLLPGGGHELIVVPGVIHTFLQHARMLPTAEETLRLVASWWELRGKDR